MKKRLSLLMVLMMVLSLVPMSAFATAGTVPGGVVSVEDNETTVEKVTVKLTQAAYDNLKAGKTKLTLSGADFAGDFSGETALPTAIQNDYEALQKVTFNANIAVGTTTAVVPVALDENFDDVATVQVPNYTLGSKDMDIVMELYVFFDEADAGDVTLAVEEVDSTGLKVADPIKVAVVKVAESDDLSMKVTDSAKKIGLDGGSLSRVEIKGFNNTDAKVFVLELPDFMSWNVVGITDNVDMTKTKVSVIGGNVVSFVRDSSDTNKATLTLDVKGVKSIVMEPSVSVKTREASMGDINLKVTSYAGPVATNSSIDSIDEVVGQLVDYDVAMTAVEDGKKEIPALYGGEEAIIKVKLSGVAGSFASNRNIDFTIDGAEIPYSGGITGLTGDFSTTVIGDKDGTIYEDGEFTLTTDADANADKTLEFTMKIKTDNAKDGAVVLTAESRDFGTLECEVAKVTPAYTVEVKNVTNIKKGESLATADVVIKEAKAGILDTNEYLVLNLSDKNRETLSFASDYTVEATNGLKLSDGIYNETGGTKNTLSTLVLDVTSTSSKEASVITISDVVVSVDGAAVDGIKTLDVFMVKDASVTKKPEAAAYAMDQDVDLDADYSIDYVNVVKEYGTVATTTVFVIGSKTYTVNGTEMTANEAPYVAGKGYTMLPVRALAESLGLKADWNSNTKTATFSNDSKVASVTLGSDTMYVNGTPIPLNAKAEIKNGSTFIELRSLASAFGVELQWDAATKTVTIVG